MNPTEVSDKVFDKIKCRLKAIWLLLTNKRFSIIVIKSQGRRYIQYETIWNGIPTNLLKKIFNSSMKTYQGIENTIDEANRVLDRWKNE